MSLSCKRISLKKAFGVFASQKHNRSFLRMFLFICRGVSCHCPAKRITLKKAFGLLDLQKDIEFCLKMCFRLFAKEFHVIVLQKE